MYNNSLIEHLQRADFFGEEVKLVKVIETHISYIFLTGDYAYKIKKPVDYGFLDFSTLEKRKYYCDEELLLNKRLCPDIYIEVLPITKRNNLIELNGSGEIIEYTLKMKEFSQKKIMKNLLEEKKVKKQFIKKINKKLIKFYNSTDKNKHIDKYGRIDKIKKNIFENFTQTEKYIGISINEDIFNYIKKISKLFIDKNINLFDNRVKDKKICDCHGDLHSGNIVLLDDKIYIFDCIEFNKRFRYCDIASDLAFLAMDLDYLNHHYYSSLFIQDYIEKTKDFEILKILHFYKSYRAYVRGKVLSFNLNNESDYNKRKNIINQAKKYFDLSRYYSSLIEINIKKKKPLLLIVFGLTGSGKSTLSMKLSIDYNAEIINTDIIRKKIAGIDIYEKHHNEFNEGLYSPDKIYSTYLRVVEEAARLLSLNKNVVIDATFQKIKYRDSVKKIAKKMKIQPIYIHCITPESVVKQWLKHRVNTKTVSDGRWEIYESQKKMFDPINYNENYIEIDMSKNLYEDRTKYYNDILSTVKGVT